jgi:hypothetical protein
MARDVNVWTSGWRATGTNVQMPQYEMVVRVEWTDSAGTPHTGQKTVTFPNDFKTIAVAHPAWAKRKLTELMLEGLRLEYGVDVEA